MMRKGVYTLKKIPNLLVLRLRRVRGKRAWE